MTTRNTTLAILAAGLVAISAIAIPAMAKEGDQGQAEERRAAAKEHREDAKAAQDAWKAACRDRNETLNESQQERCMKVKEFGDRAHKARREAHALLGAIQALERRIGRLEVREEMLEQKLESGNFTGNETAASVQEKLDKIEGHQEDMVERLQHLQERLAALHAKWDAVRDHVNERRHAADHDEDADEDGDEDDGEDDD